MKKFIRTCTRFLLFHIVSRIDRSYPYFGIFHAVNCISFLVLSKSQLVSISVDPATSFGKISPSMSAFSFTSLSLVKVPNFSGGKIIYVAIIYGLQHI